MSYDFKGNKGFRLINIYERLNRGEIINKASLSQELCVSEKSIQRDIEDLRVYLAETHNDEAEIDIRYDKVKKGYHLVRFEREWLTNKEVLAMSKILLESRAFEKEELDTLIKKLLMQTTDQDRRNVKSIITNEYRNYVPLKHNKKLLNIIWELTNCISNQNKVTFSYMRQDGVKKDRTVRPVSLMFSEYYFYLIAFIDGSDKEFPAIFRVDRISCLKKQSEKFVVPYHERFNDGEFRKRVQFMYGGHLKRIKFKFSGSSIEAVLDRLPTAKILEKNDKEYVLQAEVFGEGINMWIASQMGNAHIISVEDI